MSDKAGAVVALLVILLLIWAADTGRLQAFLAAIGIGQGVAENGTAPSNPTNQPQVTITPTITHTVTTGGKTKNQHSGTTGKDTGRIKVGG